MICADSSANAISLKLKALNIKLKLKAHNIWLKILYPYRNNAYKQLPRIVQIQNTRKVGFFFSVILKIITRVLRQYYNSVGET